MSPPKPLPVKPAAKVDPYRLEEIEQREMQAIFAFWKWAAEEAPWMKVAFEELGVKEAKGSRNNPRIVEYLKSCGTTAVNFPKVDLNSDATAWCGAFVNWCMEKAGYIGTGTAWAKDWKKWPLGRRIAKAEKGCITVFSRGDDLGHVAFCWDPKRSYYLGGNQGAGTITNARSDRVSITRVKAEVICHVWPLKPINPMLDFTIRRGIGV